MSEPPKLADVGALAEHADRMLIAKALFNGVWGELDREDRTPDDDARMLHMAHASCFHWLLAGGPVEAARGEWQCSRVYATVGRAEPARYHAERCLAICEANGIADFDIAFAHEAMARAASVAGDAAGRDRHLGLARASLDGIADSEDREIVEADLATIPT